jgi:predicted MPP superfamily phosphohydrolase
MTDCNNFKDCKQKIRTGDKIILAAFFALCALIVLAAIFTKKHSSENNKKNKDSVKIGIISDIHNCSGYRNDLSVFVKKADAEKTDFNVNLGDSINFRVGPCSDSYRDDLDWIVSNLKTNVPFHFVLGDHDIDNDKETVSYWKNSIAKEKTYYSFDTGNFHVIILDDILGGEDMREECQLDEICKKKKEDFDFYKNINSDKTVLHNFLNKEEISYEEFEKTKDARKSDYAKELDDIKWTKSSGRRDKGRIADNQLNWLKKDILETRKKKIILFSHIPIFRFINEEEIYDIGNREKVTEILKNSHKEIVAISGEAHIWHEENIDGIQYYVVDRFSKPEHPSAIFEWDKNGYRLIKN